MYWCQASGASGWKLPRISSLVGSKLSPCMTRALPSGLTSPPRYLPLPGSFTTFAHVPTPLGFALTSLPIPSCSSTFGKRTSVKTGLRYHSPTLLSSTAMCLSAPILGPSLRTSFVVSRYPAISCLLPNFLRFCFWLICSGFI